MAGEIGGPIQTEQRGANSFFFSADHDFFLTDAWRSDEQGGRKNHIHIFKSCVKFLSDFSLHIQRVQVIRRWNLAAEFQPVPNLFAIFAGLRWKITLRFVVLSCFREGDVRAGFDGVLKIAQRNVLYRGAKRLETFCG